MNLRVSLKILILLTTVLLTVKCGQQGNNSTCGANVVDSGLQLAVIETNATSDSAIYRLQLCAPANPPTVYSVYGGVNQADVTPPFNVDAAVRLKNITDALQTGQSFQVTFKATDNYFAIYQDINNGNGSFSLDNQKAMVKAHLLPNH